LKLSVLRAGAAALKVDVSSVHEVIERRGDSPLEAWREAFDHSTGDVVLCLPQGRSIKNRLN